MSDYTDIRFDVSDNGVATMAFNRPDSFNGISLQMMDEMEEILTGLYRDREVRVLVLTGIGRSFCPGADVMSVAVSGDVQPIANPAIYDETVPVLLKELPIPTIAAVNGACAGAGLGFACACDMRVAARSAVFRSAFVSIGVAGDMGMPWTLPRIVGDAAAKELMFLDEKFSAEQALSIGLVSRVWDDEEFPQKVTEMAEVITTKAPAAVRSLKRHFSSADRLDFRDFIELEFQRHYHLLATEDAAEGFAAFAQRRPARFTGQ
ncbi:MAG: enoyl-CoA hydratase/isomerase family protein [Acidimicrobiia bacterium]